MTSPNPWVNTRRSIWNRTHYSYYPGYKNYGGKGIKCLISSDELKTIWFRDKAFRMKSPSIDRIDNNGHYEFKNLRYRERSENRPPVKTDKDPCPEGHTLFVNRKQIKSGKLVNGRRCVLCNKDKWRTPQKQVK